MALAFLLISLAAHADIGTPRPGPVYVVQVQASDRATVQSLAGIFDVDDVRGDVATVYATAEELNCLRKTGFTVLEAREAVPRGKLLDGYHTYATLTNDLEAVAAAHPDICRLTSLGPSVQGRELWAVLITNHPGIEEDEPEFKYVSSIHGDEPLGMELCLDFIHLLLDGYGTDARLTDLVDTTAIWVVPLMNPDGWELGQRYNAGGFDLNQSFPAFPTNFTGTIFDGAPLGDEGRPPEVAHVMQWTAGHRFVLSANFHTGSLLVNYPYDDDGLRSGIEAPCPDDLLFQDIARRFSINNPPMWNSPLFPDGISNGNAWYTVVGGMQDWNYRFMSCNEVTIELYNAKAPPAEALPLFWDQNRESMLSYLEAVHIGVRGLVTDRDTQAPLSAKVRVDGNAHPVFTNPRLGDYHRMLLPGTYTLRYSEPRHLTRIVRNVTVGADAATRVDAALANPDVNHDGQVNAVDVYLVIKAVLGMPVPYNCDFDGDGVNAADVQALVNFILHRP